MPDVDLRLAPVTHAVARDAVMRWHYSQRLQAILNDRFGVWEDGRFVGVVLFSNGNNNVGKPFGLGRDECCELARVALGLHRTPTSRIVAIAVRLMRARRPVMKVIVS